MSSNWRKCSACKEEIPFNSKYYECSVSSCNSKRTGYVFCSVPCWERHLPTARHRDAAAVENTSPRGAEASSGNAGGGTRRIVTNKNAPAQSTNRQLYSNDILVVASKLKKYISDVGDMNTSQSVMERLSDQLRILCDRAMDEARKEGRKTVMDRDFK